MKIDFPNLIYIIAIIAWVIIGFIRKNKKKEARSATTMPPVGEPQPSEFGDILEELLGKKTAAKKTVVVPPQKPQQQKKQVRIKHNEIRQPLSMESISGTDSYQQSTKETLKEKIRATKQEQQIVQEPSVDIRSIFEEQDFDLRKAIIYSEILNPRYH